MGEADYRELAETVMTNNSYLGLATTDGADPWLAPIEYFQDEAGNFYFFSTTDARHSQHIEDNNTVAVAIWGTEEQPEYTPDLSTTLNGIQIRGKAMKLTEDEYPPIVEAALDEVPVPMPPYAAYKIEPQHAYVPVIEDGVNKRVEVDL